MSLPPTQRDGRAAATLGRLACLAAVLSAGGAAAAVDCAEVRAAAADGATPVMIAERMQLTTPDVQRCLAGVAPSTPVPHGRAAGSLLAPGLAPIDPRLPEPENAQ